MVDMYLYWSQATDNISQALVFKNNCKGHVCFFKLRES